MIVNGKTLEVNSDLTDDIVLDFLEIANQKSINTIKINSKIVTSAIMQSLFCLSLNKKIEISDVLLSKFFENIEFKD
jgi:hypothetical protein